MKLWTILWGSSFELKRSIPIYFIFYNYSIWMYLKNYCRTPPSKKEPVFSLTKLANFAMQHLGHLGLLFDVASLRRRNTKFQGNINSHQFECMYINMCKYVYLASLCDLFGMVKWPFQRISDLQLGDKNNHIESPGIFCVNSIIYSMMYVNIWFISKNYGINSDLSKSV